MKLSRIRMSGRSYTESHRVSTPLELLFDLIFVIAIASAANSLHNTLAAHHIIDGLTSFLMAFFSIWWAWMNFTWFASAYDTDDTLFRLTTFLLMFGALIFAVGVDDIFDKNIRPTIPVIGFIIMRTAMVIHWMRASKEHVENRKTTKRYALGISFAQLCWVIWLFTPTQLVFAAFIVFMLVEVCVPIFAEGKTLATNWHPHHIAERYGLLIIIVLGEGLLGASNTIAGLLKSNIHWSVVAFPLGLVATCLIFSLWWVYFELPWAKVLEKKRTRTVGFIFGYSHFFIFAALAVIGSSLELIADTAQQQYLPLGEKPAHTVSPLFAITILAIALGVFLLGISTLRILLINNSRYNRLSLIAGSLTALVPVAATYFGFGIIWALALSVVGIVIYIQLCNWERCKK